MLKKAESRSFSSADQGGIILANGSQFLKNPSSAKILTTEDVQKGMPASQIVGITSGPLRMLPSVLV